MSAETVVGPSIASGSQTSSGNWALFPAAPPRSIRPATVSKVPFAGAPIGMNDWFPLTKRKPFAAQPPFGPVIA